MRPDGKTQVTCEYRLEDGRPIPVRVHTVVISTQVIDLTAVLNFSPLEWSLKLRYILTCILLLQHSEEVTNEQIRSDLIEHVVKYVIPAEYLDEKTIYHMNPSGRFVIGGPHGDAGLTG